MVGWLVLLTSPVTGFHRNGVHVAGGAAGPPWCSGVGGSTLRDWLGLSRRPHISTSPLGSTCAWMPTLGSGMTGAHCPRTAGVSTVKTNGAAWAALSSAVVAEVMPSALSCRNVVSWSSYAIRR